MKKATFLVAALATTFFSNAQQTNDANSLLWKIDGNGLTQPSYLYGTIHFMCADDFQIKEKVANAFDSTSNLVLEVNMADPNEMQAMQNTMYSKTTLSSRLNETERTEANSILTSQIGVTLEQADNISPFGLLTTSIMSVIECRPTELKFYESEFVAKAKAQNKTIGGLEAFDSQMAAINKSYSLPEILKQISLKSEYAKVFANMTKHYKEENLPELYNDTRDRRFMDENAELLLLTGRNKAWVAKIPAIIKDKSTFFAVGAGHLYGKTGVIELLKQQGYQVTPVK
jgi:uncharacterized protein YbaP (TraB family)